MQNNLQKLYDERMTRINSAIEHKETDRIPIVSMADTWCLAYVGISLEEALADPQAEFSAYAKVCEDIPSDAGMYSGVSYPLAFAQSLGGGIYNVKSDTPQIATGHSEIMTPEEYGLLIEDPHNFIVNYVLPKKCAYLKPGTPMPQQVEGLCNSMGAMLTFLQNKGKATERFKTEYGYPIPQTPPPFMPADLILDYLRDFKGIMTDIRRYPQQLAEAAMSLCKNYNIPATFGLLSEPVYDKYLSLFLHLPPYLKPKDFEKIYWPSFKLYVDTFASKGYKLYIVFEKTFAHVIDCLRELPSDSILGNYEEDDIIMMKKALPNITPYGGMRINDLKYKTTGECVELAKKLINEAGCGGGYVFGPDKPMLTDADGKVENWKAVCEYVYKNGSYK